MWRVVNQALTYQQSRNRGNWATGSLVWFQTYQAKSTKSKVNSSHKEYFNSTLFFFKITDHDAYYLGSFPVKGLNNHFRRCKRKCKQALHIGADGSVLGWSHPGAMLSVDKNTNKTPKRLSNPTSLVVHDALLLISPLSVAIECKLFVTTLKLLTLQCFSWTTAS